MIEVGYAALHKVLFLNGKNFSDVLDTYKRPELKLLYDEKAKELLVTWKDRTAHLPSTNVAYYIPGEAVDKKVKQVASTQISNIAVTAQVETPMSHVHAGHGHGKTGQKPVKS